MADTLFTNPSWPFAAAVFNARRDTLLKDEQYERLLTKKGEGLVRALCEMGYGKGDAQQQTSIKALTEASISSLRETLYKTVPDTSVTDLFFIEFDAHNIKVILKSRLLERDCDEYLSKNGTIDCDLIKVCASADEFSTLGDAFVPLADLGGERDAQKISAAVDRACYLHIFALLKKKNLPLFDEYFSIKAKYTNALTKIRAERLGFSEELTASLLIPEGNAKYQIDLRAESVEAIELERERVCASLLYSHRNDTDGPAATAHYISQKLLEARNVRIIDALGEEAAPLLVTGNR